jgi:hypothetical protein
MGTKLRDRAKKAREAEVPDKPETPASTSARKKGGAKTKAATVAEANASTTTTPSGEPAGTDRQPSRAVDTPATPPKGNVVAIDAKAVGALTDEQVEEILASHADVDAEMGAAFLTATRTTKANQIQYDGTTPEGYIIRVWAPEGSSMLIRATLEQA